VKFVTGGVCCEDIFESLTKEAQQADPNAGLAIRLFNRPRLIGDESDALS